MAFGTFHRYVYEPFKAGRLKSSNHRLALVKARAAALALFREVTKAKQAAVGSSALRKLYAPLAALQATASSLATNLRRGRTDSLDIESVNSAITDIKVVGLSAGVHISDHLPAAAP